MANAILNVGQTGGQVNISTATAPATPAVGVVTLYAGTDKALHVKNSDGTDITIAAAGAASPITEINTNTLVSGAVGATAGTANNAVVLGSDACGNSDRAVVIGYNAFAEGAGDPNHAAVVIGWNAKASAGYSPILIGHSSCITGNGGTLIGPFSCSLPAGGGVILGDYNQNLAGNGNIAVGQAVATCGGESIAIGNGARNCGPRSILLGHTSCILGTGNENTILIGSCTTVNSGKNITIGSCAVNAATDDGINRTSIVIGHEAQSTRTGGFATVIGNLACMSGYGVNIGSSTRSTGNDGVTLVGSFSCSSGDFSTALGDTVCALANYTTVIGSTSTACSPNSNILGYCNLIPAGLTGASVIGNNLSAEKADTVHVNNLIAYGQAASKTNAIGATGGTVTINWNNSNIQTLTLDSNISTLTKSNPIDGAVYTLFLTQGGTGGKTVAWGADVEWPGGTPPTLSPTAGAVDAVSLVYIAGITGYYGNANLNFS
jgi:hypothetical protein